MAAGALWRGESQLRRPPWRLRLVLGKLGIGGSKWPDWLGWFRGFALTATPTKVGGLILVQLLHEQLGYPRLPLVHLFVTERFSDASAVALLVLVFISNQLLSSIPSLTPTWLLTMAPVAACALQLTSRRSCRR